MVNINFKKILTVFFCKLHFVSQIWRLTGSSVKTCFSKDHSVSSWDSTCCKEFQVSFSSDFSNLNFNSWFLTTFVLTHSGWLSQCLEILSITHGSLFSSTKQCAQNIGSSIKFKVPFTISFQNFYIKKWSFAKATLLSINKKNFDSNNIFFYRYMFKFEL
jgi:hypothetical protein